MNLLARLKLVKLNQTKLNQSRLDSVTFNLPFNKQQTNRNDVAYFCEHDGICIKFTQAVLTNGRTSWRAIVPCALKPWWLFLKPLRKNSNK